MDTENLQEQLDEIQAARDSIQETLESKGETVSSDIRTFAEAVNNLGNINTVNGIGADENRNAQLDASNINVDDTAETTQTIKAVIEEINAELDTKLNTPAGDNPITPMTVYGSSDNNIQHYERTGTNYVRLKFPRIKSDGNVETVSVDVKSSDKSVNIGNLKEESFDLSVKSENIIVYDVNEETGVQSGQAKLGETIRSLKSSIKAMNTEIAERLTKTEAEPFINEVVFDNSTFTFTFKNYKGETQTFDLPLESTVKSGRYDDTTKALILVLQSDDEVSIPVNELCDVYTGIDGAKVKVTVNSNNEIEATIKEGTITKTDLTSELQSEIDAKATTEYVDNAVANIDIPEFDTTEIETSISNLETNKADKTDLDSKVDVEDYNQYVRDNIDAHSELQTNIGDKLDKSEIVKEFAPTETYTENQVYNASAVNTMATTLANDLLGMTTEINTNKTAIADNKTATDTEIANLKTADTTLQTNIDTKLDKTATDNILSDVGVTLAVAGQPNAFSLSFDGINPADGTATSKSVRFEAKNQELEFHANGSYNGKTITVLPEKIVFDPKTSGLTSTKVSAAIREVQGNVDTLETKVDSISVPEYSMAESTTTEGYAKTYSLTKDGTEVGVKINIPKDLVINSGSVKEVTTANTPYTGAAVGDKYLDLVLNDSAEDHIYIPVKDLVDVYTGKAGTKVNVSISDNNEISADIVSGSIAKTDLTSALQTEITNATNKANTNAENITTNTSNINKLTSRVSVVESTASNNADNIDILETRLTNEVNTLNSSITNNANNVSTLGTRMTTAEGNIRTNSTDISTNASDIASLGNRVTTVENKASSNATNLESAFNRIGNAESKITANASNITSVTNRVTAVETKANTNETNISNLTTNKQDKLVSGTNIKTLNGETLLGEGNITIKNIDYVYSWDGQNSSTNPDNIALWQEIINKAKEGTSDILVVTHGASSYQHFLFVVNEKCLGSTMSTFKSVVSDAGTSYSINSAQETTGVDYYSDKGQVTIQHDANYVVSNVNAVSENTTRLDGYLPTNNTKITNWTPTYDYHPATKKYVDDSIDPINELIYDAEPVQGTESHTGTYYFAWDDTNKRYVSNNHAQASTTATSTLTVPSDGADMYNISWTVSSEFGFDKFSLVVNGSTVVTSSYSLQKGEYSVNPGTTVTINYSKDDSGDNLDDQATVQIIPVNKAAKASIGYVMDSVSTLNTKISNIKQAETFDGTVFGGWHMYSDGECLDDYGFDSSIYDKVKVGNIMTYPSSTTSGNSVTTVITSVESGYSYKDEGGRFYYKIFTTGAKTGALEISQDSLGTGKWYKGLELDQTYSGGVACFTAGTKVAVEEGFKNIEDIQVGDMVYSYNMETKQIELKEVDKLVSHETDTIFEILAGTERIETTWSHPFYTTNKGKCLASNLDFGDSLKTLDNRNPRVLDIAKVSKNATVYEIRVKDNYNYFVGDTSVLVFNEKSVIEDEEK